MKPYVNKDCVKSVVLWNPVDLGYAGPTSCVPSPTGRSSPAATSVKAGKWATSKSSTACEILLGPPFVFTKSNIKRLDF